MAKGVKVVKLGHASPSEELRIGRRNNEVAPRGASLADVAKLLSGNLDVAETLKEIEEELVDAQCSNQSLQQTLSPELPKRTIKPSRRVELRKLLIFRRFIKRRFH